MMPAKPQVPQKLTPREIVAELDKYIVGQGKAKRAVAIALRNRWRRQQVAPAMRDEITPKNIIMIGRTGVGKTEIARRLARLAQAPFVKVEASKFTEVGYVGRDVDSIIRDLAEAAMQMVRLEEEARVREKAAQNAEERLLDLLLPPPPPRPSAQAITAYNLASEPLRSPEDEAREREENQKTREKFRTWLRNGTLDERTVELDVKSGTGLPMFELFGAGSGMEEMGMHIKDMLGNLMPQKTKQRRLTVKQALHVLTEEEAQRLIDSDKVQREAISRAETSGIVFLDEIDKIAGRENAHGPDVSREGVQRDILPIVEGSTVATKYGAVRTDHILFIAAGAFHVAKPSDLIPELQGRFPIRVELDSLTKDDFVRILTEPENCLTKQYAELLATEDITLAFEPEAVARLAEIAEQVNASTENIGARRLHTILERLLDDILFKASDIEPQTIRITAAYVDERLTDVLKSEDLSRYIL